MGPSSTAHSLSYSPYKFPRLTGMSDDFTRARAAAAPTRMTRSAELSPFRLLGNGDEVSSAATPTSAADQAIAPSINIDMPPIGNIHKHAPALAAAAVTETAVSSTAGVEAGLRSSGGAVGAVVTSALPISGGSLARKQNRRKVKAIRQAAKRAAARQILGPFAPPVRGL